MQIRARLYGIPGPPGTNDTVREALLDFLGGSAQEFLELLLAKLDRETRRLYLAREGGLSSDVAVRVNGIAVAEAGLAELLLAEGDVVEVALFPGL